MSAGVDLIGGTHYREGLTSSIARGKKNGVVSSPPLADTSAVARTADPEKDAVRNAMRAARAALDPHARHAAAAAAAERLTSVPAFANAHAVALYSALAFELDPTPAFDALLRRGVRVAYPRVVRGRRDLEFAWIADLAALVPGAFGIREPARDAPPASPAEIEVFVVPGLAFDLAGHRVGWGQGHYDATRALRPGPWWIGYGYDFQLVPSVPARPHDQPMDAVVTDVRTVSEIGVSSLFRQVDSGRRSC